MLTEKKPTSQIFISHSSEDWQFVYHSVALRLQGLGYKVWYDKWSIAVGDSIVEKIFSGLSESDALIIVLSKNSINSKWVKEELSFTVMRKLSDSDIRLFPVLIDDCEIPHPLRHIKYADFRSSEEDGFNSLVGAISPLQDLWVLLEQNHQRASEICNKLNNTAGNERVMIDVVVAIGRELFQLANLRTEIEARRSGHMQRIFGLYDQIEFLESSGLQPRSKTWAHIYHAYGSLSHYGGPFDNETKTLFRRLSEYTSRQRIINEYQGRNA